MRPLLLWGPVLLLMGFIFFASSLSDPGPLLPATVSDKAAHFAGYALLAVLIVRALAGGRIGGVTLRAGLVAVAVCAAYGVSDELHQRFVPGRSSDARDVLADTLGACGGAALCSVVRLLRG